MATDREERRLLQSVAEDLHGMRCSLVLIARHLIGGLDIEEEAQLKKESQQAAASLKRSREQLEAAVSAATKKEK